jgi:hypothetical protein
MGDIWLIYNPRSKSSNEQLVADVEQRFAEAGQPVARKLVIGEDDLPGGSDPAMAGVDMVVLLSGDGTVNAAAQRLAGWPGTLLILPGGTMNLLAHALHGEAAIYDIVDALLDGKGATATVPVIKVGDVTAFAGIIVGPSSAWADVREDMRNLDLKAIGPDAVQALQATLNGPGVAIQGVDATFPAIYLEPGPDGLRAFGVQAESGRDLLAHGWAWLRGDFRNGPSRELPVGDHVTLSSRADSFDMLVDGERADAPNPATFAQGLSDVRFFSMRGQVRWS